MVASLTVGCSGGNDTAQTDTPAETEAPAEDAAPAGDAAGDDAGAPAAEGGKIGISMPTQSLERWNRDGAYLDEQFKAAGFETVLTYSDNDSGKQVNDIQNMLADGVNLLVVAAIDGEALNTAMNEAAEANVPVISYDRLIL
ncbi:MAG: substrate-binding domain-containing protein, partial [Lachnospiraceae bacterium]|nr:substrate-binding domain-containing protein [Lachnospiraceae bacterium]